MKVYQTQRVAKVLPSNLYTVAEQAAARFGSEAICDTSCHFWLMKLMPGKGLLEQSQDHNGVELIFHSTAYSTFEIIFQLQHGLRMPGEEIAFAAWPKINSHSQIFRYG